MHAGFLCDIYQRIYNLRFLVKCKYEDNISNIY